MNSKVDQMLYLMAVAKSPHRLKGLIFRKEWKDWYRALLSAVSEYRKLKEGGAPACFLVVTAFQKAKSKKGRRKNKLGKRARYVCEKKAPEWVIYRDELLLLGVPEEDIVIIREGFHTGDQVQIAEAYTKKNGAILWLFVTTFHFAHVLYYVRLSTTMLTSAFGFFSLKEGPKDLVMPFFAKFIDAFFDYRAQFEAWVGRRRGVEMKL